MFARQGDRRVLQEITPKSGGSIQMSACALIYLNKGKTMTVQTVGQTAGSGLSWMQLLFTLTGRATRFDYWVRFVVTYVVGLIIAGVVDGLAGTTDPKSGLGLFSTLWILAAIWPNIAVGCKRCHDRDRSGWFQLIGLVPLLNIWLLIEMGFLAGTAGSNRFGPDPRGAKA